MRLISAALVFMMLTACIRRTVDTCQQITQNGYSNSPNCDFTGVTKKVSYDEIGLIRQHYRSDLKNIVFLGDNLISGEPLNKSLPELLQDRLLKLGISEYQIVNAGIRDVTTKMLSEKYVVISKKYQPKVTILFLNNDRQFFKDYYEIYKNQICPIAKIWKSFRAQYRNDFFKNTIDAVKNIKSEVERTNGHLIVITDAVLFRTSTILRLMPACRGFDLLTGQDPITSDHVMQYFLENDLDVISLSTLDIWLNARAISKNPTETAQNAVIKLAYRLTPWVMTRIE